MKCPDCKKLQDDTRWEIIGKWIMKYIFPTIYEDIKNDFYTQGISQGYKLGWEQRDFRAKDDDNLRIDPLFKLRSGEEISKEEKNFILKEYLGAIVLDDILTIDKNKNKVFLNGLEVADNHLGRLIEEARTLKTYNIWSIIQNTLADNARKKMFEKSTSFEDMFWGKTMLYNLDVIQKIVDQLSQ